MRLWALVSRDCRETVELYLDEGAAHAALRDVLRDEPSLVSSLAIVELEWTASVDDAASVN
jgi:hypothetical protein